MNRSGFKEGPVIAPSPRWVEVFSGLWMCVLTLLGTFLNSLIFLTFVKRKRRATQNDIFVIALLANHALMSATSYVAPAIAEFIGGWLVVMDFKYCIFQAFVVYWLGMASLFLLMSVSVARYISIVKPMLSVRFSRKLAIILTFLCELMALMLALAPLFGWCSYGLEAHGTSCGLNWTDSRAGSVVYIKTIFVLCYAVPVCVMIFSYLRIYVTVRKSRNATTAIMLNAQNKERRLIKMCAAMAGVFLISWTPYAAVSLYRVLNQPDYMNPIVSRVPAIFAKTEVLWNPIIYAFASKTFRRYVYEILPCAKLRSWLTEMDSTNEDVQSQPSQVAVSSIRLSAHWPKPPLKQTTESTVQQFHQVSPFTFHRAIPDSPDLNLE